jgi:hypothetical protein
MPDASPTVVVAVREVRAGGAGPCDVPEAGALEIDARKIGSTQVGTHEVVALEIGTREIGTTEVGVLEAGSLEVGTRQIGLTQVEAGQVAAGQLLASERRRARRDRSGEGPGGDSTLVVKDLTSDGGGRSVVTLMVMGAPVPQTPPGGRRDLFVSGHLAELDAGEGDAGRGPASCSCTKHEFI